MVFGFREFSAGHRLGLEVVLLFVSGVGFSFCSLSVVETLRARYLHGRLLGYGHHTVQFGFIRTTSPPYRPPRSTRVLSLRACLAYATYPDPRVLLVSGFYRWFRVGEVGEWGRGRGAGLCRLRVVVFMVMVLSSS